MERYECKTCGSIQVDKNNLACHMRDFHETNSFCCEICGTKFLSVLSLDEHTKSVHNKGQQNPTTYSCFECFKIFKSNKDVLMHKQNCHSLTEFFECEICHMKSRSEEHIKEHKQIDHVSTEEFECSMCGSMQSTKNDLNSHMRDIHNVKYFYCDSCGIKFMSLASLNEHTKSVYERTSNNTPQKINKSCRYYSRRACKFTDDDCKFIHTKVPECRYQERCRSPRLCKFAHHPPSLPTSASCYPSTSSPVSATCHHPLPRSGSGRSISRWLSSQEGLRQSKDFPSVQQNPWSSGHPFYSFHQGQLNHIR